MADMFVKIEKGTSVIHIEGAAIIDNAVQIHQTFLEAFENMLPVVLDAELITDCDSTFVQLIASLCFTLEHKGRTLGFSHDVLPDAIFQVVKSFGFQIRCNCTRIDNKECLFTKAFFNTTEHKQESLL
jgi:anti-anti-sigma regulatory factor